MTTKIPIFIIVHNQYEILKKAVESYEKYIKTPIEIIFHDVCTTYFETINYLESKKKEGYKVYRSNVNNHHTVMESIKHYISMNPSCEYVVMTDADIELYNVNGDILEYYVHLLNQLKKISVGPMLKIDDIPDEYYNKNQAVRGHSRQFWSKERKSYTFKNVNYEYIDCMTDTTFQLFSTKNIPKSFPHDNSLRTLHPYSARHLDWYTDPNNITPCQLYYLNTTTGISHWNNKNWKGTPYYGLKVNVVNDFFKIKNEYIYYNNVSNEFGDNIISFMYESIFMKKAILDINGGSNNSDVIFGTGSILSHATSNSIIWGTGLMSPDEFVREPRQISSVRGPLTRRRLVELGIECPEKYGDIALALPYFYHPEVKKKYKVGIIVKNKDQYTFAHDPEVKIIEIIAPVQNVINEILECETTISSNLYGIIVSHAYNIKCMWVEIEDNNDIGYFKFRDYYTSYDVNQPNYDKENLLPYIYSFTRGVPNTNELIMLINKYPNPSFPCNIKSVIELCPFLTIKK